MLTFETITTRTGFEALQDEWNHLFDIASTQSNVFQSYVWNKHWLDHLGPSDTGNGERLNIVVGRLDGRIQLILPLLQVKRLGQTHLTWIGAPVTQYGDALIVTHRRAADWLLDAFRYAAVTSQAQLFDLRKVRADGNVAKIIPLAGGIATSTSQAAFMDFSGVPDADSYINAQPGRSKKQRRRLRKKLSQHGELSFRCYESGQEAATYTQQAIHLKKLSLQKKGALSRAFCNDNISSFFKAFTGDTTQNTNCLVSVLASCQRPVAIEIGLRQHDWYFAHIGSFDEAFSKFAPGRLQIEDTIRACFEHGIQRYDLLAPDDAYKMAWADGTVEVSDYAIPLTMAGKIYTSTILRTARPWLKYGYENAPARFRNWIASTHNMVTSKAA